MKEKDRQLLLSKINIVDLISEYVDLTKSGSGYKGLSPFKEEKTPSFMVSPTKNIFKDFSTNVGGDAIKFYMLINNKTYNEAMKELAQKYNVKLSSISKTTDKNYKKYEIMRKAMKYFNQNLLNNKKALDYLKQRGYDINDIEKFRLGYADDNWTSLYDELKKEYNDNELLELGLVAKTNNRIYDVFRNRIMFPVLNENLNIIAFGGRDISFDKEVAKYINSKESPIFTKSNELFGLYDGGKIIREYGSCVLVEGFFDVISMQKNNITNVIASLGTSLTKNQAKKIRKFTENIVILYDEDTAGLDAKIRAINILNEYSFNIKIMSLENEAKDPDEYLQKFGRDKFVEKYKKSKDAVEFLIDYYSKDVDINKLASKTKLITDLNPYFSSIKSSIIYDNAINILSKKINISKDILKSNIKFLEKKIEEETKNNNTKIKKKIIDKRLELERLTIKYLLLRKNDIKLFKDFNFRYDTLDSIFQKLKDENINNYTEDEEETIFDIETSYSNKIKEKVNELVREWVLIETDEIIELLKLYGNNVNTMSTSEYKEYLDLIKGRKSIEKSVEIDKIIKVFNDFKDYENKKLYNYKEQENN